MTDSTAGSLLAGPCRTGFMVAFEGLDGAGKSTQIARLAAALRTEGCKVHVFRLNSNPVFKQQCRLLNQEDLINSTQAALMKAAELTGRYEYHIKPLLESGAVVLWDKYIVGSLAMDAARGVPDSYLRAIQAGLPTPALTLYLAITPEEALRRKNSAGGPRLMESGLDQQLGVPVRRAFELWKTGAIAPDVIAESFQNFQMRLSVAYERFLPWPSTVRFDATEEVDTLSARICRAVSTAGCGSRISSSQV